MSTHVAPALTRSSFVPTVPLVRRLPARDEYRVELIGAHIMCANVRCSRQPAGLAHVSLASLEAHYGDLHAFVLLAHQWHPELQILVGRANQNGARRSCKPLRKRCGGGFSYTTAFSTESSQFLAGRAIAHLHRKDWGTFSPPHVTYCPTATSVPSLLHLVKGHTRAG